MPDYYLGHDGLWGAPYSIFIVGCDWLIWSSHVGLSGRNKENVINWVKQGEA